MNGIHDMGGMQGMGAILLEQDEPVFHAAWEGRLFALRRAAGAWGKWNIDASRHAIERVSPAEQLQASYFARQYLGFIKLLVERELLSAQELATGHPAAGEPTRTPALRREQVPRLVAHGFPVRRDVEAASRFSVGQSVRTKQLNPSTHTRLPRYARGRVGTIVRDCGVFVFPDTNAQFLGEKPQHLYCVRFAAQELWGQQAGARDSVHLDLWSDYLDAV